MNAHVAPRAIELSEMPHATLALLASEIDVERAELIQALADLYDAVQRGAFDHVGVERNAEAIATRAALAKHGAVFDQFFRRIGAPP